VLLLRTLNLNLSGSHSVTLAAAPTADRAYSVPDKDGTFEIIREVVTESGSTRTLSLADAFRRIRIAGACAITLEQQSAVAWPANSEIVLVLSGGIIPTIVVPTGGFGEALVTVNNLSALQWAQPYDEIRLVRVSSNVWDLVVNQIVGDLIRSIPPYNGSKYANGYLDVTATVSAHLGGLTLGGVSYSWTPTGPLGANQILIPSSGIGFVSGVIQGIVNAINLGSGGASPNANLAAEAIGNRIYFYAKTAGTAGNSVGISSSSEYFTTSGSTLSGGVNAEGALLGGPTPAAYLGQHCLVGHPNSSLRRIFIAIRKDPVLWQEIPNA
jgi:hypothetical protein